MATARIVLRIVSSTQSVKDIPLDRLVRLPAEPGATYKVIDAATQKPLGGIVLKKKGDALLVEIDSEPAAQVEHFYADNQTGAFDVGSGGGAGESHLITQSTPTAEGGDVVWQAGSDQAGVAVAGESSEFVLGGALLGGVGLAAGGGGGAAAPAVVNNIVAGTIVGGPVVATNDLKVVAYQADGVTVLGEGVVDASGRFSISVGSYTGVVIAKVVNQGTGADYLDEATNAGKDLNVQLFSSGVVTAPNTTLTLNINVLTTVAYHKAVAVVGGNPLDVATVDNTNTAIAQTFGVQDLHATQIVTVNGTTTYNAADGLSAGETYGAVLAAFSGADQANAGNSQATVDNIVAGMTVTGATATLNAAAQTEIITGGQTANVNAGGAITAILDTIAPNAPTLGTVLSNSATPTLRGTAEAGATVTVTVGGATYSVVADVNGNWSVNTATAAPASGTFTPLTGATNPAIVMAIDSAGNVSTAGVGNFVVDTVAPNAPTLALGGDTGSSTTDGLTSNGTVNVAGIEAGATWEYSLDGGTTWTAGTGTSVTLNGDGAKSLTVRQTDAAGNSGTALTQAYTLDTTAPTASATTETIASTASTTVQSSETGTAYLVSTAITANALTDITNAADTAWNSVAITAANTNTSLAATGLAAGTYKLYTSDAAGNLSVPSANTATVASGADTSIVVFDLIEGVSSSHSSRTFDATLTYDIYIRVSSVSNTLSTDGISAATPNGGGWGQWGGVSNLGADDRITLVGNGTPLIGSGGGSAVSGSVIRAAVTNQIWRTAGGMYAARFHWNGSLTRNAAGISFAHLFVPNTRLPASIGASYNTNGGAIGYGISIATNILTTQGLA